MRISDWSSDVCSSDLGAATIRGRSMLLASSGSLDLDLAAEIDGDALALDAGAVSFASEGTVRPGLIITPELQSRLAGITSLTIRPPGLIAFESGRYSFGKLPQTGSEPGREKG